MALTEAEREVAVKWLAKQGKQQKLRISDVTSIFDFMIDNQLPSQATMIAELDTEATKRDQSRIVKLRAELNKLEGR